MTAPDACTDLPRQSLAAAADRSILKRKFCSFGLSLDCKCCLSLHAVPAKTWNWPRGKTFSFYRLKIHSPQD
jgi:hypothetical protein